MNKINKQLNKFWERVDTWAVNPGLTNKQIESRKTYLDALGAVIIMSVAVGAVLIFSLVFIGTLHIIINYPDQLGIAILAGMPLFFLGWTIRVLLFKPQPISAGDEEVRVEDEMKIVWDPDKARLESDPWKEDWSEW